MVYRHVGNSEDTGGGVVDFNMYEIFSNMFKPVTDFIYGFFLVVLVGAIALLVGFIAIFMIRYRINPFNCCAGYLMILRIKWWPYDLLRWFIYDLLTMKQRKKVFNRFGFTIFCGRQGSGKTISMVDYLNKAKEAYPKCKIVTNFQYANADYIMKDWHDFLEIRNGEDGVIFAIDEIHSEYSAESWKDFPETILSEISQQRKQRIKIVATAQVFSRCAKQIREQAFSVIMCTTFLGRLTMTREYDAAEYGTSDSPYMVKKRCRPISRGLFVQSDKLRECYDTFEKIERMKKIEFIKRHER